MPAKWHPAVARTIRPTNAITDANETTDGAVGVRRVGGGTAREAFMVMDGSFGRRNVSQLAIGHYPDLTISQF